MKILLLGSSGQLGKELERQLPAVGGVTALPRSALDVSNYNAVQDAIRHIQPNIIVNAAAYTAVDKAEAVAEQANNINAEAVANLAQIAKEENAWLIHYSTDYVFDGSKSEPYVETDDTHPINVYGTSKLAGERAITSSGCLYFLFRSSWVIGKDGNNFAKTILKLAAERSHIKVVSDQLGVPTSPSLISKVTINAIQDINTSKPWEPGVYHVAPKGASNWYEIARTLVKYAERLNVPLCATTADIQQISSAEYPTVAKRPPNSLLNTQKLQAQLSFELPHWRDDFLGVAEEIIKELKSA